MATVDKNFKVKHGLVVEGTTATVNGDNIVTATAAQTIQNKTVQGDLVITSAGGAGGTNQKITTDNNGKLTVHSGWDVAIAAAGGDITLEATGDVYVGSVTAGNKVATKGWVGSNYDASGAAAAAETNSKTYTDNLIGDPTVNGTTGNTVKARIDSAVANLVDGAPALLNTLNELAAAIADNPNYATDVATLVSTKADTTYVDTRDSAVDLAAQGYATTAETNAKTYANGLAVNYDAAGSAAIAETNAKTYADGLAVNYDPAGSASTAETNAKTYADTNFVNLTQKGSANGVATLDTTGNVPLSQLGNIPAAYITSVGTNLNVTTGQLTISSGPTFTEVDVNSVAKQVASVTSIANSATATVYAFDKSVYRSAKFLVKVAEGTNTEISEVLLTLDSTDNIAITEYAVVGTNGSLSHISADIISGTVALQVTATAGNSTVSVSGTLLV